MSDTSVPMFADSGESMSHDRQVAALVRLIREIGMARYVGRVNAGVIPANTGYEALEQFVQDEKRRPFASRFVHFFAGKPDNYDRE